VLNTLDVIILVIILLGIVLGYMRGVVGEVFAIIGVCVGTLLASHFYLTGQSALQPILRDPEISLFIGYLALFLFGMLAFLLVRLLLKSAMADKTPGSTSRLLAALLGGLKSILLITVVIFLIIFIWGPDNGFTSSSQLVTRYLARCRPVVSLLPEAMQEPLHEYLDTLKPATPEKEGEEGV
jgi:membrane protein required for colicin V production